MQYDYSVQVQDAVKSYGNINVLKKLCMKVERSQIYGLLGSSGCGKTTLLNAIVGTKEIESGTIWVLGEKSGVRGAKIGYMPQDIALVREFTVKDAIYYFGRVFLMNEQAIAHRYKELSDLLDLPPHDRFLKDCSGGQQRRVSLAVALVHNPELLILDEPTVGIDPLLREKIWSYLFNITKTENITVIITTHYIEECRQADKIGLMRDGQLLTEDSPKNLLNIFKTQSLEEVFLILSQKQESGQLYEYKKSLIDKAIETNVSLESIPEGYKSTDALTEKRKRKLNLISGKRMRALLDKNAKQFYRNFVAVSFLLFLPIVQVLVVLYSIGLDMKNIPIGIVNDESMSAFCSDFSLNGTALPDETSVSCHLHNLSCRFLNYHLKHPMIRKVEYDSVEKATTDVTHGILSGVLYIPKNFSESYEHRLEDGFDISGDILDFSTIKVRLDMSNHQIGTSVKNKLIDLYFEFQRSVFKDCNFIGGYGDLPVQTEYVYGSKDESYQVFVLPGTLITMIFFFGSMMTSQIMITEKHEGIWDRSIVAGVTTFELTISHLLFQSLVAVFQTLEMLIVVYVIYQNEYVGSMLLMYIIVYLEGICGMAFGLLISVVCTNISMANNASLGFYLPLLIISGCLWPIEGMPKVLQILARIFPAALPIESLNSVVKKGLSIDTLKVASGIGVCVFWIIVFVALSLLLLRRQR